MSYVKYCIVNLVFYGECTAKAVSYNIDWNVKAVSYDVGLEQCTVKAMSYDVDCTVKAVSYNVDSVL